VNTAADRITEYLRQRAVAGNERTIIATPTLYPNHATQPLTLTDLEEVTAAAADLEKAARALQAQAWDQCALWYWKEGQSTPNPADNPYRD